jgi:hypothetical protein
MSDDPIDLAPIEAYEAYWIEPRLDGDYLVTTVEGEEKSVYLGDGCSLKDAIVEATLDIKKRSDTS